MSTFISVGNAKQPFTRLLQALIQAPALLPTPVVVQCGHTPFAHAGWKIVPFMQMEEFIDAIGAATLVISHAGAGCIINAVQAGKVPVVMPRRAEFGEHVNDHQLELARALDAAGKVILVDQAGDMATAVARALGRFADAGIDTPRAAPREAQLVGRARQVFSGFAADSTNND